MGLELLMQIFQVCIIPILGILTTFVVKYINIKCNQLLAKIENETAQKYLIMIEDTVTKCVKATNQTYVESLKKSGSFDEAAQKQALQNTLDAVMKTLSKDALGYIEEISGDASAFLLSHIEASVNMNK